MHADTALLVRSLGWLALSVVIFIPIERVWYLHKHKVLSQISLTNISWYFINSLITLPLLVLPSALIAQIVAHIEPGHWRGLVAGLPLGLRMVLALLVGEVGFYWGHRLSHRWQWLWRFHAVHHHAHELTFLVNTRMHPVDMVFTRMCGLLLLIVTGLVTPTSAAGNLSVAIALLAGSLWSYFVHANIRFKLRGLTWLLATPHFHHWHHAYGDDRGANFAAMVPVVDRLFGTYRLPEGWPEQYGSSTILPSGLLDQLAWPFWPRRVPKWDNARQRLSKDSADKP